MWEVSCIYWLLLPSTLPLPIFQKYDSKMAEVGGAWSWNRCYSLMVMTVAYIVGEVAHFLINTTGRAVAREIHFGDSACFPANNKTKLATNAKKCDKKVTA